MPTYQEYAPTLSQHFTEDKILKIKKASKKASKPKQALTKAKIKKIIDCFDDVSKHNGYTSIAAMAGVHSSVVKKLHQEYLQVHANAQT